MSAIFDKIYAERDPISAYIVAKGRDLPKDSIKKEVPEWFSGSYSEYCDCIHDYINGM